MADKLLIKISERSGYVRDLRYRYFWSAWLDGKLLGRGNALNPVAAEAKAMDLVTNLVTADGVDHVEVVLAERPGSRSAGKTC